MTFEQYYQHLKDTDQLMGTNGTNLESIVYWAMMLGWQAGYEEAKKDKEYDT